MGVKGTVGRAQHSMGSAILTSYAAPARPPHPQLCRWCPQGLPERPRQAAGSPAQQKPKAAGSCPQQADDEGRRQGGCLPACLARVGIARGAAGPLTARTCSWLLPPPSHRPRSSVPRPPQLVPTSCASSTSASRRAGCVGGPVSSRRRRRLAAAAAAARRCVPPRLSFLPPFCLPSCRMHTRPRSRPMCSSNCSSSRRPSRTTPRHADPRRPAPCSPCRRRTPRCTSTWQPCRSWRPPTA